MASCETSLAFYKFAPQKRNQKLVGVVNFNRRGTQFYDFNVKIFTGQWLSQKFIEIIKYSQSYEFVCQLALLGSKGLTFLGMGMDIFWNYTL